MTSTATVLEIACAKPDCHWRGSPADAPGHACPTPAGNGSATVAEGPPPPHPFAGMVDAEGKPIADELADRTLPFWVVWNDDAGEIRIIGTRPTMDAAVELSQSIETTVGEVTIREQPAPPPPPSHEPPPAANADPHTRDELERWLLAYGSYDDQGAPQDEKTATLDARLSVLLDVAQADEEPDLDETIDGEAVETDAEYVTVTVDQPWQLLVARQIQAGPSHLKWVVVDTTRGTLIGRAKTKKDAQVYALVADAEIMRADAVLEAAAEIEKRRELVEEPARTTTEQKPGEADDPPTPPAESAPGDEDADSAPGALFDANQYETEELQLAKVDGQTIDRIKVAFSGSIMLDRSAPNDVALYRKLALGTEVELRVAGRVSGTGAKGATNRDGDLDVIVGEKTIAVTTVYRLTAEELE